jgi:DNA-binding CsgD family transcriptional regulator
MVVTPRQAEILTLVSLGMGDKEIAGHLGVAPRTVRTHLERLFREYRFSNRAEAVTAWLQSKRRLRSAPTNLDIGVIGKNTDIMRAARPRSGRTAQAPDQPS